FFFSSRRRHTRCYRDWSSDVCSSDLAKLYVPLERLDLVEKFRASGEGAKPALDRLGGITWARTKSRVKRALRDMAEELLRLYAEIGRASCRGGVGLGGGGRRVKRKRE